MFIIGNMFKWYEYVVVMLLRGWGAGGNGGVFFLESEKHNCNRCTSHSFLKTHNFKVFCLTEMYVGFGLVFLVFFFIVCLGFVFLVVFFSKSCHIKAKTHLQNPSVVVCFSGQWVQLQNSITNTKPERGSRGRYANSCRKSSQRAT